MLARSSRVAFFLLAVLFAAVTVPTAVAAPSLPSFAGVTLDVNNPVVTGGPPPGAVPTSDLQHGCEFRSGYSPTIIVAAGGNISGGCNWSSPAVSGFPWNETWTGSYSGTMNPVTGQTTFSHTTQYIMEFASSGKTLTYNISFSGTSTAHGNLGANGPATFTYAKSCSPGTSSCSANETMSYSGTITKFFLSLEGPVTGVDVEVDHIEVVQVVQTTMNTVPLVADKTTVARVFFSTPLEVPITSLTLKARRNGNLLTGQPTLLPGGATVARDFDSLKSEGDSVNFRLPMSWVTAGAIELEAVLVHSGPPDPNSSNNTRFENVTFQTRRPMTIFHMEVCIDNPPATCAYDESNATPQKFETFYPLPNGGLIYRRLPIPSVVVSPAAFDTAESADATLRRLGKYQLLNKLRDPAGAGDQLIGWIPSIPWFVGAADSRYSGGSGLAAFVTWFQERQEYTYDTLLHEVAHNLGSRHPSTADSCGANSSITDWPYPNARVQEPGWDVRTDSVIPADYHDIMSYCHVSQAMSPFTYTKLFNANSEPAGGMAPLALTNYAVVSGTAKADGSGGTLDPIVHSGSLATFPPSDPAGTHCIRFNDAPASDYCFWMDFEGENGEPLSEAAFVVAAPFTGIINSLKLCETPCGPADTVTTLAGSANWPFAQFVPPAPGTLAGPSATISWAATDADPGTTLTYTLFQSIDAAQNFTPVVVDTTETSFTFDASEIQQGTSFFLLYVSDGLKNNSASLGPVTVGTPRPWGDQTCNGDIDLADTLALRSAVASLPGGPPIARGCPSTGGPASLDVMPSSMAAADITWGDLDCTGGLAANDVLALLRVMAGLPVAPGTGSCPDIGEPVYASG